METATPRNVQFIYHTDNPLLVPTNLSYNLVKTPPSQPFLFSTTTRSRRACHSVVWPNEHSVLLARAFAQESWYPCSPCLVDLKNRVVVRALGNWGKMAAAIARHSPGFELRAHFQQTVDCISVLTMRVVHHWIIHSSFLNWTLFCTAAIAEIYLISRS